jgi:hypothetical protein
MVAMLTLTTAIVIIFIHNCYSMLCHFCAKLATCSHAYRRPLVSLCLRFLGNGLLTMVEVLTVCVAVILNRVLSLEWAFLGWYRMQIVHL